MRFQPTIDIWSLTDEQRASLQPGQWVMAGPSGPRGRFLGQGRTTVVGWLDNARGHRSYRAYMRTLRDYARSISR